MNGKALEDLGAAVSLKPEFEAVMKL